jgi:hypothetical protein
VPSAFKALEIGQEEREESSEVMRIPMTDNRLNSSMLRPKKPFARRLGVTLIVSCLCAPDRLQVRQINKDIYDFNDLGASRSLCRSLSPVHNVLPYNVVRSMHLTSYGFPLTLTVQSSGGE